MARIEYRPRLGCPQCGGKGVHLVTDKGRVTLRCSACRHAVALGNAR